MRRFILALWLILISVSAATATEIMVNSTNIENWQYGGTTAKLRIYASHSFITGGSTGANKVIIAGSPTSGKFYKEISITISGTTATIPQFTIDSTLDGKDVKISRYSAYFYSSTGSKLGIFEPFDNFAIPASFDTGTSTSWAGIAVYNRGTATAPQTNLTYTQDVIDAKIAAINGLTNPMTGFGDMITGNSSGSPTRITGSSSATVQFLGATNAALPSFISLTSSHITTALSFTPVNKAGDTMTGLLTLSGAPTQANHAATKAYVDGLVGGGGITQLNGLTAGVQTFAVGANAINSASAAFLTITSSGSTHTFDFSGALAAVRGGTGVGAYSTGDLLYANASTTLTTLNIGAANRVLRSTGSAPSWGLLVLTTDVSGILPAANGGTNNAFTQFSGPTTTAKTFTLPDASAAILTTNAAVTAVQGGTGIASYTVGDILYADSTTTLAKRAVGASNTVLRVSGGLPTWGAVALTTDVSGALPVANGGTGLTAGTSGGVPYFSSTSTIASSGALTANGVVLGGGAGASPTSTAAGTANQVLRVPGAGGAPAFGAIDLAQAAAVTGALGVANGGTALTATPTTGQILVGNGTGYTLTATPTVSAVTVNTQTGFVNSPYGAAAGNTSEHRFLELAANGTNYVGFKAPDAITSNIIWVLPAVDGANGDQLTTNGAGILSWTAQGGGGGGGGVTSVNGLTGVISVATRNTGSTIAVTPVNPNINIDIPDMAGSGVTRGVLTDTTQTLPGAKTFSGAATFSSTVAINNTLTFAAGTTTVAPAKFQSSSLLTTPVAFSLENDNTRIYYTNSSAARKSIAHLDDNVAGFTGSLAGDISGTQGATSYNGIVPVNKGGTGANLTLTIGDFLYANSTTTLARVGGNTTTTKMFLSQTGTAGVPNAPAWSLIDLSTSDVTGNLTLNKGGTGASLTIGANGTVLQSNGTAVVFGTDGSALTSINATNISSGTLGDARLSTNVLLLADINATTSARAIAGLTNAASPKLIETQGQEVWDITDLTDYATTSGTGSVALRTTITSPVNGDLLQWNGTNWVNTAASAVSNHSLLSATHNDSDTGAGSIALGDLFYVTDIDPGAGVSLRWSRLAVGAVDTVLTSTGSVPAYSTNPQVGTLATTGQAALTVKAYNTGVGQTGELRFRELDAGGSDYVGFKSPDALAASAIFTLPAVDGAVDEVLVTNGSKVLSFKSLASMGMAGWTDDGTTVRLTTSTDVVSIGANSPIANTLLSLQQGTITTDKQGLGLTTTWNAGGVDFTAIKATITNTASGANSKFLNYTLGATSRFSVTRDGTILANSDGAGIVIGIPNASGDLSKKIFRGVVSTAWSDSSTSTFFQIGDPLDQVVFQTASGNSAGRVLFNSISTYISEMGHTAVVANATKLATVDIQQNAWGTGLAAGRSIMRITGGAMTAQTADIENIDVHVDIGRTVQITAGGGAFPSQRAVYVENPTYAMTAADSITSITTMALQGAPGVGTNLTATNSYALLIEAGTNSGTPTNAASLAIADAPPNGTNKYALWVQNGVSKMAGYAPAYAEKNANYTTTINDNFLSVDAGAGGVTITLIAVASVPVGFELTIKKIAGAGSVTIDPNGTETIDDDSTSRVLSGMYTSLTIVSDGDEWFIK